MNVPVVDLVRQHGQLADEISGMVRRAVESGAFVGGAEVDGFEREYAEYLGAGDVVAVGTGTAALHLALRALDVCPTDEVILPANSFIATAEAVVLAGARPVFCDVDAVTGLATRETMAGALTANTRALIPVHLYGHVTDMDPILELADSNGIVVIEDAAQAHGARYLAGGTTRRVGSIGHVAAFSFYPAKNLGAIGEGGACAVNDPELARRIRMLRDHGQARKHVHDLVGDNGRLAAIQAGALRIKLPHLDGWNARRREIARRYDSAIESLPIVAIPSPAWSESVYHQYVVRVAEREAWSSALSARGVASAVHYPIPIHLQPAFAGLGYRAGSLPAVETLASEVLSIPVIPELGDHEVEHVVSTLDALADELSEGRAALTGTDEV